MDDRNDLVGVVRDRPPAQLYSHTGALLMSCSLCRRILHDQQRGCHFLVHSAQPRFGTQKGEGDLWTESALETESVASPEGSQSVTGIRLSGE